MANKPSVKIRVNPAWGIIGFVFVILKLAGVIAWPWWAVLLPFVPYPASVVVICVVALLLLLDDACTKNRS